jgi:hypothetical protein
MSFCFTIAIYSIIGSVWGMHPFHSASASFRAEPDDDVRQWRGRVSEILFDTPGWLGYLSFKRIGPFFMCEDSAKDDHVVDQMLRGMYESVGVSASQFRLILSCLVDSEDVRREPNSTRIRKMVKEAGSMSIKLKAYPRERLLVYQAKLLLLAFDHPASAANMLQDFSRRACSTSPSLAQVALVHAIDIYRELGNQERENELFKWGQRVYGENNPTQYGVYYWYPDLTITGQAKPDGKVVNRAPVNDGDSHEPWRR